MDKNRRQDLHSVFTVSRKQKYPQKNFSRFHIPSKIETIILTTLSSFLKNKTDSALFISKSFATHSSLKILFLSLTQSAFSCFLLIIYLDSKITANFQQLFAPMSHHNRRLHKHNSTRGQTPFIISLT